MANEVRIKLTPEQKAKIKSATGQDMSEIRVGNVGSNPAVTGPKTQATTRAASRSMAGRVVAPKAAARGNATRAVVARQAARAGAARTFSARNASRAQPTRGNAD